MMTCIEGFNYCNRRIIGPKTAVWNLNGKDLCISYSNFRGCFITREWETALGRNLSQNLISRSGAASETIFSCLGFYKTKLYSNLSAKFCC